MTPLGLMAYRGLTSLIAPAAPWLLGVRARRGKEDLSRLGERVGRPGLPRPAGPLIWLHAASVGESLSLLPLIHGLGRRRPGTWLLVTAGTTTAADLLARRLPEGVIHQYVPIDGPQETARFLEAWRPALGVFVESELWPNLILAAADRGVALALVSARLSERSLRQWRWAPATARALFGAFDLILAQDEGAQARLEALGARVDGRLNLKRSMERLPVDQEMARDTASRLEGRPLVLAASTHDGEETLVLEAFRAAGGKGVLTLAPRHPGRGDRVEALIREGGLSVRRRSRGEKVEPGAVYLLDTIGELGAFFALAEGAFIGGSLVEGPGGHNPLEATLFGCPAYAGPHVANWTDVYADLEGRGAAVRVGDGRDLSRAFASAINRDPAPRAAAERVRTALEAERARLDDVLARLEALIP